MYMCIHVCICPFCVCVHVMYVCVYIYSIYIYIYIREYGSTLYVGMAPKKNGRPYISIASDELKSLVIYTDKF